MTIHRDLDGLLDGLKAEFTETAPLYDREARFPVENFRRLHQLGLLSLTVPVGDGGGGDLATAAKVVRAIGAAEPSTALVLTMQYLFQRNAAHNPRWPATMRDRVLRSAVKDGALGNALRVEPELGTPARGGLPATIARRVDGGWRISGHKIFSTGVPLLTWLGVWGRSDDDEPLVGTFIVPRGTEGIRIVESWDHLGMRASGSHDVIFDDVFIPTDHAVDLQPAAVAASAGFRGDLLSWGTVLISELYQGVAEAARDWLVAFAVGRVPANLGASLATLPRFQEVLGDIQTKLSVNRLLLDQAIAGNIASPLDLGAIKYTVTNNAIAAVEAAVSLSGNHGLSRHNPLERHYRNVLCSRIHTPQNDSILLGAGRAAFAAFEQRKVA
jgi:alkylation response protein AidB-like acyl-CoA dehydrogenase